MLGEYEYNALHWRGAKRARSPGAGSLDEMRLMYYSANWQLLEERIDRSWTSSFTEDERAQTFWGKRYIDDAVGRRRDRDANGTWDNNFFYVTDAQFSTVAMVSASNARVVERTTYDSYGKARHHFGGDVTGDGAATAAGDDAALVTTIGLGSNSIGQANYKAEQDLNRDGQITTADRTTLAALTGGADQAALASGMVSFTTTGSGGSTVHGPDNPIAWDGYVFNAETGQYLVRFRWYDPVLGRWLERDPIGYSGGISLYFYVDGSPAMRVDFIGLLGPDGKGGWRDFWYIVTEVAKGTGQDVCDVLVGTKQGLDFVVKESVILVGNTIGLIDDDLLEESKIASAVVSADLDSPDSSTAGLLCDVVSDVAVAWADHVATGIVEGDPYVIGEILRDVGSVGTGLGGGAKCLITATSRLRPGACNVQVMCRYMSNAELEATRKSGLLRGGRTDSRHYATRAYPKTTRSNRIAQPRCR